jgi:hypothetical protein
MILAKHKFCWKTINNLNWHACKWKTDSDPSYSIINCQKKFIIQGIHFNRYGSQKKLYIPLKQAGQMEGFLRVPTLRHKSNFPISNKFWRGQVANILNLLIFSHNIASQELKEKINKSLTEEIICFCGKPS